MAKTRKPSYAALKRHVAQLQEQLREAQDDKSKFAYKARTLESELDQHRSHNRELSEKLADADSFKKADRRLRLEIGQILGIETPEDRKIPIGGREFDPPPSWVRIVFEIGRKVK